MAGKSKNAYTDAILAVIDEYKMVVKDAEKPGKRTPKIMEEKPPARSQKPSLPLLREAMNKAGMLPRRRGW